MQTVGDLIKKLQAYPHGMSVTNEQNLDFIHMTCFIDTVILSTQKPIAICNRTNTYIYPTTTDGYYGFSPELDEDVYKFETMPLD